MAKRPKVVYLPSQCHAPDCARFPWATVDGVPYCKPHGDEAIERTERGG